MWKTEGRMKEKAKDGTYKLQGGEVRGLRPQRRVQPTLLAAKMLSLLQSK